MIHFGRANKGKHNHLFLIYLVNSSKFFDPFESDTRNSDTNSFRRLAGSSGQN